MLSQKWDLLFPFLAIYKNNNILRLTPRSVVTGLRHFFEQLRNPPEHGYITMYFTIPLWMNIQVVSSLCCNKPAVSVSNLASAFHRKVLSELKAFSEYLLYAVFIKYTIEICDIVPSSKSAKYSWGKKPNPHKTIKVFKTRLNQAAYTSGKWIPSFPSAWRQTAVRALMFQRGFLRF